MLGHTEEEQSEILDVMQANVRISCAPPFWTPPLLFLLLPMHRSTCRPLELRVMLDVAASPRLTREAPFSASVAMPKSLRVLLCFQSFFSISDGHVLREKCVAVQGGNCVELGDWLAARLPV